MSILNYDSNGRPIYKGDVCYQVFLQKIVRIEEPLIVLRRSLLCTEGKFKCVRVQTRSKDCVAVDPRTVRVYNGSDPMLRPSLYSFHDLIKSIKAPT